MILSRYPWHGSSFLIVCTHTVRGSNKLFHYNTLKGSGGGCRALHRGCLVVLYIYCIIRTPSTSVGLPEGTGDEVDGGINVVYPD